MADKDSGESEGRENKPAETVYLYLNIVWWQQPHNI